MIDEDARTRRAEEFVIIARRVLEDRTIKTKFVAALDECDTYRNSTCSSEAPVWKLGDAIRPVIDDFYTERGIAPPAGTTNVEWLVSQCVRGRLGAPEEILTDSNFLRNEFEAKNHPINSKNFLSVMGWSWISSGRD
jgi:hypothetical protein